MEKAKFPVRKEKFPYWEFFFPLWPYRAAACPPAARLAAPFQSHVTGPRKRAALCPTANKPADEMTRKTPRQTFCPGPFRFPSSTIRNKNQRQRKEKNFLLSLTVRTDLVRTAPGTPSRYIWMRPPRRNHLAGFPRHADGFLGKSVPPPTAYPSWPHPASGLHSAPPPKAW